MNLWQLTFYFNNAVHTLFSSVFQFLGVYPKFKVYKRGIVLVTGSSTGIGFDACLALAKIGFTVYAGVRREVDGEKLLDAIKSNGKIIPIILDVTKEQDVENAVQIISQKMEESGEPLVAVFANAGLSGIKSSVENYDRKEWDKLWNVNVYGVINIVQATLPLLRRSNGRLIMTSSVGGFVASPTITPYAAGKFVLEALADGMRIELRPWKVSVSLLEPGAIKSAIWSAANSDASTNESDPYNALAKRVGMTAKRLETQALRPSESTSLAVVHAITSKYPRPRYVVGMDGVILSTLRGLLPDRIWDFVLGSRLKWL